MPSDATPIAYTLPGGAKIEHARARDPRSYWVVRRGFNCVDDDGRWLEEPPPGRRDESFIRRSRFATAADAYRAWRRTGEEPSAMKGESTEHGGPMPHALASGYTLPGGATLECTTPRDKTPERWAVRAGGRCLNREGGWEPEPSPQKRTLDFAERCRWPTAEEAYAAWRSQPERHPS